MKIVKRVTARSISPRREIIRSLRYLPNDKLEIILKKIRELDTDALTQDDIAAIEEGRCAVKNGDVISLDQFCRNANL